jgi:hypothetical protein
LFKAEFVRFGSLIIVQRSYGNSRFSVVDQRFATILVPFFLLERI